MYLFYDTETTGLPKKYGAAPTDLNNWPRLVQLSFGLFDDRRQLVHTATRIVIPVGFTIPDDAAAKHGITTERALREGLPLEYVLGEVAGPMGMATTHVAHHIAYDEPVMHAEYLRKDLPVPFSPASQRVCTMRSTRGFCKIPRADSRGHKNPTLTELHRFLFGEDFANAHDANADMNALARCYFALEDRGFWHKE